MVLGSKISTVHPRFVLKFPPEVEVFDPPSLVKLQKVVWIASTAVSSMAQICGIMWDKHLDVDRR